MLKLKELFGCNTLLAPRLETFFVENVPIEALPVEFGAASTTLRSIPSRMAGVFAAGYWLPGRYKLVAIKGKGTVDLLKEYGRGEVRQFWTRAGGMMVRIWDRGDFAYAGVAAAAPSRLRKNSRNAAIREVQPRESPVISNHDLRAEGFPTPFSAAC
jgi:hypothetical protein